MKNLVGGLFVLGAICCSGQELLDCTEEALGSALGEGGLVVLDDCSMAISNGFLISTPITIVGEGTNTTLNAGNRTRIFTVAGGGRLEVQNITFTGGRSVSGGAVFVHANAEAVFSNCVFSANSALGEDGTNGVAGDDQPGIGDDGCAGANGTNGLGGAVFNKGNVVFLNCRFLRNSATGGDGGTGGPGGSGRAQGGQGGRGGNGGTGRGGGLFNAGTATVWDTFFEANTVRAGNGGVAGAAGSGAFGGMIRSGGSGGAAIGAAIFNSGVLELVNTTFSTNSAFGGDSANAGGNNGGTTGGKGPTGGSAFGGALANTGQAWTTNCTFSQNLTVGGKGGNGGNGRAIAGNGGDGGPAQGGGLYNNGVQWLMNCTFSENRVAGGTNGVAGSGARGGKNGRRGVALGASVTGAAPGRIHYQNSIFAYPRGAKNGTGRLRAIGNNISSDGTVPLGSRGARRDPLLYSLAYSGGPVPTMVPRSRSFAINRGRTQGAPEFDARGFTRPDSEEGSVDIGAVEVQSVTFLEQPESQTVPEGGSVTFEVNALGDLPIAYIWSRNGNIIPGAVGSSYTISQVTSAMAGAYSVLVSNQVGIARSTNAILTVTPAVAPVITNQPAAQTVLVGSNVTFTVGASGTPPFHLQWRSNTVANAGATNWSFQLLNVRTNYTADYSVRITNYAGAVTSQIARLTVITTTNLP
jgi:hypothetical protein